MLLRTDLDSLSPASIFFFFYANKPPEVLKTIDEAKFKHLSNLESVLGDIFFGNLVLLQGSNDS